MHKRYLFSLLTILGAVFTLQPTTLQAQQASADIQTTANGKASTTTEVSGQAGGQVVIEILAQGFNGALGVDATFTISEPSAITGVSGNHKVGLSFPGNPINNWNSGDTTIHFQSGGLPPGAIEDTSVSGLQVVGEITLTLADPFIPFELTLPEIILSLQPNVTVPANTVLKVTQPLNNKVTRVSVSRRHSSAKLTWRTKLDGIVNQVQYRVDGTEEWTSVITDLQTNTSEALITAVKALRTAKVNIQRATPADIATALTAAGIDDTSDTFIASIKIFDATLRSRIHEVTITGLTANTKYNYQIVATALDGDLSPAKTGSFKTRLSPDVRPAAISNVNASITANKVTLKWRTNRRGTSLYKIYTRDASGNRGSLVTENETPSASAKGKTSHKATIQNLMSATEYEFEIGTRLTGVDDLVAENLMTEAQVTATETGIFKTLSTLPPVRLLRSPKITRGTDNAQLRVQANQPVTVFVDYGQRTSGRPKGDIPGTSDFDADPLYPSRVVSTEPQALHTLDLSGLDAQSRYRYRVTLYPLEGDGSFTTDPRGKTRYSKDYNFRTLNDIPVPNITRGPIVRAWRSRAWFRVVTNVPTTMSLFYGTDATFGTADEIEVIHEDRNGNPRTSRFHRVLLTGLTGQTSYQFRMEFANIQGETLVWPAPSSGKPSAGKFQVSGSTGGFGTTNEDDTTNPLITRGPTIVASTENSLTVEWVTDEPATSTVAFGNAADNLDSQTSDGESVLTHRVTLTGLTANTPYAFQVGSTDVSGNGPVQSTVSFATTLAEADITAPKITTAPTLLYASNTTAEINWKTDELSFGELNFGTDPNNLDQTRSLTEDAIDHIISLTDLTANTMYYYQVAMTDANDNGPTTSDILSFQTASTADTQAPVISNVTVTPLETSAIVTWTTDEIADGAIQFGTDATSLTGNIGDIESVTDHSLVISNLTAGTQYTFIVQSTDRSGNGPAQTEQATFTTLATGVATPPVAPEGIAARAGNGTVLVSWNAPPADATGLVLERAVGDGEFAPLTTLDAVTTFTDNTVENDIAYRYQVRSQGLVGLGDPSTTTESTTPSETAGPSTPSLSAIQGEPVTPTLIINNSTPLNESDVLTYTFQLSTQEDYSDIVEVATVASGTSGTTSHTLERELTDRITYFYRIKANDGFSDSPFLTGSFTVNASAPAYPGDLNGDLIVGFPDFLAFVAAFNTTQGQDAYSPDADLDSSGDVGFPDFLQFVAVFNKDYNTSSGKPVIAFDYGQDLNAKFNLFGRFVQDAEERTLAVDVRLLEVSDIQGYGIELQYDPNALEFVSATDQGDTFLNTADQVAQLFGVLDHNPETGQLYIASSMATGASVSGGGTLATLTFKLIDPNPGNADINIAQGILFTPDQNANMAVNLGDRFNIMPTDYALDHNFPNPFNPETTIRYAIPQAGKVTLAIYNVLGQEVTRLVDADLLPGFYTVSWNGKDALGRGVASGIYLYRIQADNFTQTHKMLLLK